MVSSVLQGQLPSIISYKNTVSCYFYSISFPSIFLSCFQSITPACPDLSGPFWTDHLGLSQGFLAGPSQRLWIYHPDKYMVNIDSFCFRWTNSSSSKSRGCWTPAQSAEVVTSPLKWDCGDVRDRPPSRTAPQGGTRSMWSWSPSSTAREAPPLRNCLSNLQPGYSQALLPPPVLPAEPSAQFSLKDRFLPWIPAHFSVFPPSASEHWKPFLWNCQALVTLQHNFW